MRFTATPVRIEAACENCRRPVEIDCEGYAGPDGYPTYNEFRCPHCGKLSRVRTPGWIIAVRPVATQAQ